MKTVRITITTLVFIYLSSYGVISAAQANNNQLNVDRKFLSTGFDDIGMNPLVLYTRTPTGLLNHDPWNYDELKPLANSDWSYSFSMEAGYLATAGDPETARFNEYGDWDESPVLNRFAVNLENSDGKYINAYGAGAGRADQYYDVSIGKYGSHDLNINFDSTPHVISRTARILWDGAGTGNLTLPQGLTPGGNSLPDVLNAFQGRGNSELSVDREKLSIAYRMTSLKNLELFADASLEWRDGAQVFGGAFSFPGLQQLSETVEPVDYTTTDFSTGFHYTGERYLVNLSYTGSFFHNHIPSLVWENPGLGITPLPGIDIVPGRGRFTLAPDNTYHAINGNLATSLPLWNTSITTSISWNTMLQDEPLLPPLIGDGLLGFPGNTLDRDLWNTTGALSTLNTDARIETLMMHLRMIASPRSDLRLTTEIRYTDQENSTRYLARNPLTGQYGYPTLDGGLGVFIPPRSGIYNPALSGNQVRIRNIPFEKDTWAISLESDYRLLPATRLIASWEHRQDDYAYREIDKLDEDSFRLEIIHRGHDIGTLRLSYQYADRDGDDYNHAPYDDFYSIALPGYVQRFADGDVPHTLSSLRKYTIGDRVSHKVGARVNLIIHEKMDLMLSGSHEVEDYDALHGVKDTQSTTANLEWNYLFATHGSVYAWYSWQHLERDVANINDAGALSADPDPGGLVYPLDNAWNEIVDEDNHSLGAGMNIAVDDISFDISYGYHYSSSKINYSYATPFAFQNLFTAQEAGNGFPDQTFRLHLLKASLGWHFRENMNLNFIYRFENEDINDYHYDGLTSPVVGTDIYLATAPDDYNVHVFGVMLEVDF